MDEDPANPTSSLDPRDEAPADGQDDVGRREFLNVAWKALAVALAVEAGWTTFDILNPKPSSAFGGVIEAGTVGDYPEGTVKYFLDGRCYVTSADGAVVALYQKCPHLGCRVPFCESSGRFECPCHGSIYNIRGEYIEGPAPRGMDRFLIKVDGDTIHVDTGSLVEGPPRGVSTVPSDAKGPSCVGNSTAGTGGST